MEKRGQVDIWYLITRTLSMFPPIYILAFIGIKAYGQSLRKTAKALDLTVADIKKWNKKIERKVRKTLKEEGANLKSISDTYGLDYILEISNEEEEEEDNE